MLMGLFLITINASDVADFSSSSTEAGEFPLHCPESFPSFSPKPAEGQEQQKKDVEPAWDQAGKEKVRANLEQFAQRISGILAKDDLPVKELFLLEDMVKKQLGTNRVFFAAHSSFMPELCDVMSPHQIKLIEFLKQIQGRIKAVEQKMYKDNIKKVRGIIQDAMNKLSRNDQNKDDDCCCSFFSWF